MVSLLRKAAGKGQSSGSDSLMGNRKGIYKNKTIQNEGIFNGKKKIMETGLTVY